jgi:hypothetical protein
LNSLWNSGTTAGVKANRTIQLGLAIVFLLHITQAFASAERVPQKCARFLGRMASLSFFIAAGGAASIGLKVYQYETERKQPILGAFVTAPDLSQESEFLRYGLAGTAVFGGAAFLISAFDPSEPDDETENKEETQ